MSVVNYLHALTHRPETGWDPVPPDHAESYSQVEWEEFYPTNVLRLIDGLGSRIGGLEGKRVLDLGGGPGQYSVGFARRGARVTWHDISQKYRSIAQQYAEKNGVNIEFSLGYLEDAKKFIDSQFDLVFVRGCWFCCINDRNFAKLVYQLVKPGGAGYIDTFDFDRKGQWKLELKYYLNKYLWFKVGHPNPPPGRVANLINSYKLDHMSVDYSPEGNDFVFFIKSKSKAT